MFNPINLSEKAGARDWNKEVDSVFTSKEEFTTISASVIEVAEQEFTLIDGAFPTQLVDGNKKKYEYTTLSEVGDAEVLQKPSDFPAMSVNGTIATVDVPWKGIGFELQKEDIANSKNLGQKLDVLHARIAGKKVRKLQDECLFSKSSAFGTLGIDGQATGTFAGSNWTTTTTNIYDQVRQWIQTIPAARAQDSMVLILNATQKGELFRDSWDNGTAIIQVTGGSFMAKIKAAWPGLRIIQSQWATATEGILYPFNEEVVRRIVGVTPTVIEWHQNPIAIEYVAMARDILVVPTPASVIKGTGL